MSEAEKNEAIDVEAKPVEETNAVEENKKEKEEKEKSILKNPKRMGKIKIELMPDGRVFLLGKNVNDNDELPLFLVTYGINLMLNKDVDPSLIIGGIINYKPLKEKLIVKQHEGEQQKGLDTSNKSSNEVNPLFGMLGSMMASMTASKASNNKDNKAKSNT